MLRIRDVHEILKMSDWWAYMIGSGGEREVGGGSDGFYLVRVHKIRIFR